MLLRLMMRILLILFIGTTILITACAQYTLSTSVIPGGSGTISPEGGIYNGGTELTLAATPADGYVFDHWSGDVTGASDSVTLTMDSDKTTVAHFMAQYTLSTSVVPSDSGTIFPQGGIYDGDAKLTLVATPADGYVFDHWLGAITGTSDSVTLTMDSDKRVVAHFKAQYTLSTSVAPNGSGTISPEGGIYDGGTELTLAAAPADGYVFDHWSGDVTGDSTSVIITINNSSTIIAHFRMFFSEVFSQVVNGKGYPLANEYLGSEHPVILLGPSGNEHEWSDELPMEWLPRSAEETQLVVCVGEEEKRKIETCYYDGPDIKRYQYRLEINLIEAKTGYTIARTTLSGSMPRKCENEEPYSLTELRGTHVSFDQVQEWLQQQTTWEASDGSN